MRRLFRLSAVLLVFFVAMGMGSLCSAEEPAPEKAPPRVIPEDLTADLNTTFYSKYIWRGLELSKDSLVIFPSLTIGYKGFAFNIWTDMDTRYGNPPPDQDKKDFKLWETDLTLSYSNKIKPLKLDYTVGWIYYHTDGFFGDTSAQNQELFVTLAYDWPLLKPTLSVYQEIETGQAWYASLALSHSFAVYKDWSLDVGGLVSYQSNHSTDNISAFHDGNIWASLTIPLSKFWSITPKAQYSFPLSSDANDQIKASSFNGRDSKWVYGGIIFDLKF